MTSRFRKSLRILLPLALGAGLLVLLYRRVDFGVVRQTLREEVDGGVLFATCLLGPLSVLFRGLRWDLQVRPLREGPSGTLLLSLLHVQGNYAVNMALPHLGDLWRCSSMASYTGLPFSSLLGTLLAERVVDLLATVLLIVPGLLLQAGYFTSFLRDHVALPGGGLLLLLALAGLAGVVLSVVAARRSEAVRRGWRGFVTGLRTLGAMDRRTGALFLLYTLCIWVCYFLAFYLTFFAFDFTRDLGAGAALLIFSLITLTSILPVQGNIGPWHFVVIRSLVFFGVAEDPAASFALIVHTSQTVVTTLVGLAALFVLPLLRSKAK